MNPSIAIVGMACRYPDARSPAELWENVLAERRAFRRMPPERLNLDDYFSADPEAPDRTYSQHAALIENYEFDRVGFQISGSTYRSSDAAHWLALDIAAQALGDAGFANGPPRESTGVYLGNTLTGEFSRANTLRLRWPYVRRVLSSALAAEGWPAEKLEAFLRNLEPAYKQPFPPMGEDTLAGGLSNTIAGRIANYFDLKGGGYTVDGACASSLLAVATACSALVAGDVQVALAGGVDISLDPFELVGFAKSRALASEDMRIFDAHPTGFWPGEGCGFVVLMRQADALAGRHRIYATVRGWGISSDGGGGISRPEAEGQLLAVRRAYCRAGFPPSTVAYFEGHGTGTRAGDDAELEVLTRARREADPSAPPAAIGSVKANIGHTKAAAGVAGLIKAALAVHHEVLPPTTGCQTPHPALAEDAPALRILRQAEPWPEGVPRRAATSAMGFGGINTHVVLEGGAEPRRASVPLCCAQDAEIFLFTSAEQIAPLAAMAARLSRAELTDAAAHLAAAAAAHLAGAADCGSAFRKAVVASTPEELAGKLTRIALDIGELRSPAPRRVSAQQTRVSAPRIGLLFPGQGSPLYPDGGALFRRFRSILDEDLRPGSALQPGIVKTALAALRVLRHLSLEASIAVGHSLGELAAYCWAGALEEASVIDLATARGRLMSSLPGPAGAMASVALAPRELPALCDGDSIVMACFNSPHQTVVSGEAGGVERVVERARSRGVAAFKLPVSHAFHSPLVEPVAQPFAEYLGEMEFRPLDRAVISTITGARLPRHADLRDLLRRQITSPVRFTDALAAARGQADLWIEAGPGSVLTALAADVLDAPVVAMDAGGPSLRGLLEAVAAAFELGAPVDPVALFAGRFARPFHGLPRFMASPCEAPAAVAANGGQAAGAALVTAPVETLDLIRQLIAERTELPASAIQPQKRLLTDLHLNSITVAQLVVEAARRRGWPAPRAPLQFADATVAEVAHLLESTPAVAPEQGLPPGVDSWVRAFQVDLAPRPLPARASYADARGRGLDAGEWQAFVPDGHPLAPQMPRLMASLPAAGGVLLCLPPSPDETNIALMLEAAHAALDRAQPSHFIMLQQNGGAAALARTLHLESSRLTTCVIDLPFDDPRAAEWIAAEAHAARGYVEAHYDRDGCRREPVLRPCEATSGGATRLTAQDVLLVTGGGKGIAAECALALARDTGVQLALLGRSDPSSDAELAANLERMRASGIQLRYLRADVRDAASVAAAFREIEKSLGPVTGILHGAGVNTPRLLTTLDESAFRATLAPKLDGLRNLLEAADPERLRLLVAFGSIIARMGLAGEADYAVANEWLARAVDGWQADHPQCRSVTLEWSVWSGLGMGQRLGRIEALLREGVTPITPEEGVRVFKDLLARAWDASAMVVTGRFGEPRTLRQGLAELPFARFLERPRVHYPGVELIADFELSARTDPYLNDHVFQGTRLFPAVMGLEAMAQAAAALFSASSLWQKPRSAGMAGETACATIVLQQGACPGGAGIESAGVPVFEDVQFARTITAPEIGSTTVRVAALVRAPGVIEVVLRSSETAFQVDHFRARCRMAARAGRDELACAPPEGDVIPLDPGRDLYGSILFQSGRFQRVRAYRQLRATECLAEIAPPDAADWFARYLPGSLVLGDPGVRDAFIHCVQASIPHATVLPAGVRRITVDATDAPGVRYVHARERSSDGTLLVYDLDITTATGQLVERWEGLQLRVVDAIKRKQPWAAPLLGPYLERRVREHLPNSSIFVAVERGTSPQRRTGSSFRRPDGKPESNGCAVSASHAGDLVMTVESGTLTACDMELVAARTPAVWRDMLGPERCALRDVIVRETGEDLEAAATRVWCAIECLKKAGAMYDRPLVFHTGHSGGWIELAAGSARILTCTAAVGSAENRMVFAILSES